MNILNKFYYHSVIRRSRQPQCVSVDLILYIERCFLVQFSCGHVLCRAVAGIRSLGCGPARYRDRHRRRRRGRRRRPPGCSAAHWLAAGRHVTGSARGGQWAGAPRGCDGREPAGDSELSGRWSGQVVGSITPFWCASISALHIRVIWGS